LYIRELGQFVATDYTIGSFEIGQFDPHSVPEKNDILASACGLLNVDRSGKVRFMRESPFPDIVQR